jgi:hypothetical protein
MQRIIIPGSLLLTLAACGGGTPAPANDAVATPAAPAPGVLASPDGRSEVRRDAQFSGLPEGIPAYPNVTGGGAVQIGGVSDGNEMRVMAFRTADPPAQVIAFYADAAARAGFRIIHRAEAGPSTVLGLERDTGDVVNITATGTPRATSVQIMAGHQRNRR